VPVAAEGSSNDQCSCRVAPGKKGHASFASSHTVTATSNLDTVSSRHLSILVVSGSSAVANTPDGAEYYTTQPVRQQLFGLSSAGELIAQGATAAEAVSEIGMVVEGLTTAPVLRDLSHRLGIELPISEGVCAVLEGVSISDLVVQLMSRAPTTE